MKSRKLVSISVSAVMVILVLVAMAWLAGVFRRNTIEPGKLATTSAVPQGEHVVVEDVQRAPIADVAGTVQAEVKSSVASRLVANIVELKVNAGDRVKQNDVLVMLDDAGPKARVAQARDALRAAESNRVLAEVESKRVAEAAEAKAASASERDTWRARLDTATAEVSRAQQNIKEAEVGLEDATLRSPISGIVIDRLAEPGEQASPGKPLLTIYDPDKLRVEAYVREAYIGQLRQGQELSAYVETLGQIRKAKITQIVPTADPASRSFLIKAVLEDSSGLYPGMFARLQLSLPPEHVLVVPQKAIESIGQLTFASVIADGRVERRAVRVGKGLGENVEILAGLKSGEQLLVRQAGSN